jgi:ComF family protein
MRRFAFSSNRDLTRGTETEAASRQPLVHKSWLVPQRVSRSSSSHSALISSLAIPVTHVVESLFSTFFPSDCRLCHEPLTTISRFPVCDACVYAIRPITGEFCSRCGERLASVSVFLVESVASGEPSKNGEERLCLLCKRAKPLYAKAAAYGSYDGGLRELIHLLKYGGVRPAAGVLGRMLAEVIAHLEPRFGQKEVIVVPVPLHSSKLRQRGFNQAELIAKHALKGIRPDRMQLNSKLLERVRVTQSQIGLTRHQRRENLRGAFSIAKPHGLTGREVLLVDDVFTTGTTVSECARVLRRAGASNVYVATVARTLKIHANYAEPEFGDESRITMAATAV